MNPANPKLRIDEHPFYIGPITPENNLNVPMSLPFYLGVHPKYAIPVLILTDQIYAALQKAYSYGSMLSTPLGESALSENRMLEMLKNLLSLFAGNVKNLSFLEVGCGSCTLLNELKKKGAKVIGVEIGPQGQEGAKRYGLQVIDKPFKPGVVQEKVDCVFSYGCLEHIVELEDFFLASRDCLKENGLFFHCIPNSELHFNLGSRNHLVHEHVNYFTPNNAVRLFNSQGFCSTQFYKSNAGNELYIWGYKNGAKLSWPGDRIEVVMEESKQLEEYSNKLVMTTTRIVGELERMQSSGLSMGFYAGGFEYSIFLKNVDKIRYFDGDPYKQGKVWLRDLSCIESPQVLEKWPVENLIICKNHYFESIVRHLVEEINISKNIKLQKLYDLGI